MADALAKLSLPWDVAPAPAPAPTQARMESVLRGLRPSAAQCGGAQQAVATATTQGETDGFFTLGQVGERWVLLTPDRKPFFSLGLNHIDAATLRTVENGRIWRQKYGNSMHRWLDESVRVKLKEWGFNTCGWSQEVVAGGPSLVIHSRPWTYDEYQSLDTPYCHLLPFTEIHQWEAQTKHPDFFGAEFWQACDYVAREHCAAMRDDPNLIGYWYSDCPTWVHNSGSGPLFEKDLETAEGRSELQALATQYYKVLHDAIRRYDPHHLILGEHSRLRASFSWDLLMTFLILALCRRSVRGQRSATDGGRRGGEALRGRPRLPGLLGPGLRTDAGVAHEDGDACALGGWGAAAGGLWLRQ